MNKDLFTYIIFGLFVFIIYLILCHYGIINTSNNWSRYINKEGGYSVLIPKSADMKNSKEIIPTGAGEIIFYNSITKYSAIVYNVGYSKLLDLFFENFIPEKILSDMVLMMQANDTIKLIYKEKKKLQGYPAIYAEYEDRKGNRMIAFYCLRNQRFYRAMSFINKSDLKSKRRYCKKFVKSLKLN